MQICSLLYIQAVETGSERPGAPKTEEAILYLQFSTEGIRKADCVNKENYVPTYKKTTRDRRTTINIKDSKKRKSGGKY